MWKVGEWENRDAEALCNGKLTLKINVYGERVEIEAFGNVSELRGKILRNIKKKY